MLPWKCVCVCLCGWERESEQCCWCFPVCAQHTSECRLRVSVSVNCILSSFPVLIYFLHSVTGGQTFLIRYAFQNLDYPRCCGWGEWSLTSWKLSFFLFLKKEEPQWIKRWLSGRMREHPGEINIFKVRLWNEFFPWSQIRILKTRFLFYHYETLSLTGMSQLHLQLLPEAEH